MTKLFWSCKVRAAFQAIMCFMLMAPLCSVGRDIAGVNVSDDALLEEISRAAFLYFIQEADPVSGMVRDKTGAEYCSTAALGFGLAALPIGVERGWINRKDAEGRALAALRILAHSSAHHEGVFCHYLDLHTGEASDRGYETVASTIDTALLMAGVITAGQYFTGECKKLADNLFARINWRHYVNPDNGQVYMAWQPEQSEQTDSKATATTAGASRLAADPAINTLCRAISREASGVTIPPAEHWHRTGPPCHFHSSDRTLLRHCGICVTWKSTVDRSGKIHNKADTGCPMHSTLTKTGFPTKPSESLTARCCL